MSVDIVGRHGHNQNANNQLTINPSGRNKYKHVRDYSLRMSRHPDDQRKTGVDNSLHDISVNHGHQHSKSLMKASTNLGNSPLDEYSNSQQANILDKKKELLEKKRYEQLHKNYNQQSGSNKHAQSVSVHHGKDDTGDQGGAGDGEPSAKLDSSVQLNLENLTKIDDKFQSLIDQLK